MTPRKELHFFDRLFHRGIAWYEKQFEPSAEQTQLGEATPDYVYYAEARDRMLETLPDAKLVVILRDPAKRAYSHYWHSHRRGWEDKPFEVALDLEQERLASPDPEERSRYSYVDRGHYIDQLLSIESKHDRSLLHVLLLDDWKADQPAALARLFEFIGVDPGPARTIPELWRNRPRVPDPDLGRKVVVGYPPMSTEVRARLVKAFTESNRRLAEWLGRDLSAWNEV